MKKIVIDAGKKIETFWWAKNEAKFCKDPATDDDDDITEYAHSRFITKI